MFNGYVEASPIDNAISKVLYKHSITKDTSIEWATFVRTIRTSLDLIDGEIRALPKECPRCGGRGEVL